MATEAQIEASRANGKKSKGPTTPQGRLAASMNALKTGRRSVKAALLRGDSLTFEERRCKWLGAEDPPTDMGEFLVAQMVSLTCEFERALQAHVQRLNTAIDNSDNTEAEKIYDMLDRLFGDPSGHRCLFGNTPNNRTKLKKTSGDGVDPDQLNPRKLVAAMESSEMGCTALYANWQDLKSQLDGSTGTFWQALHRLKAIRMLGCNPIQANENLRVAEIFVASHGLHPGERENPFDDLLSDMSETQHARFCKGVWELWPDELKFARKPANAREILIDLCDEHIGNLAAKLVEQAENKENHILETVTSLKIDYTPEGKDARAYLMKCAGAVKRGAETLRKYKADQRKHQRERGYEEPRKIHEPGLTRERRNRSADDASFMNPDTSWALEPYPSGDVPIAKQRNEARWAEAANAQLSIPEFEPIPTPLLPGEGRGDGLALPTAAARGDDRPASPRKAQPGAFDQRHDAGEGEGESSRDQSAAAAPAGVMSRQGENCQNATNEPEIDENVIIVNSEDSVGVMANHDADSGLDKGCRSSVVSGPLPVVSGRLSAGDTGRSSDRDRNETGAGVEEEEEIVDSASGGQKPESRTSKLKPRLTNREAGDLPWGDRVAGGDRRAHDQKRERASQKEWKRKRKALQRDLEEKLMTGKASMQEVLMELKTAAARMNEVPLPPHRPRPPSPPSPEDRADGTNQSERAPPNSP